MSPLERMTQLLHDLLLHNLWRKFLQIILEDLLQAQSQALTSIPLLRDGFLLHLVGGKDTKGRKLKIFEGKVQGQSNRGTLQKRVSHERRRGWES